MSVYFKPIQGTTLKINACKKEEGQILFSTDGGGIFIDKYQDGELVREAIATKGGDDSRTIINGTIYSSSWVADSSDYYQEVTNNDIKDGFYIIISNGTGLDVQQEWNKIANATASNGKIRFEVLNQSAPVVDLNFTAIPR